MGLSQPSRGAFITVLDRDPFPATIFQAYEAQQGETGIGVSVRQAEALSLPDMLTVTVLLSAEGVDPARLPRLELDCGRDALKSQVLWADDFQSATAYFAFAPTGQADAMTLRVYAQDEGDAVLIRLAPRP